MKRLIYLAALTLSLVLAFYSPAGAYAALALVLAALISAAENLISREAPHAEPAQAVIEEGSTLRLRFQSKKMYKGTLLAENSFTHESIRIPFTAKQSGEIPLTVIQNCGQLSFRFLKLRRSDICALTSKRVSCTISGECTVMPKPKLPADSDAESSASAERELSGAREYSQGDELRRINFKLTHRFSKIYINTFSPEDRGLLCLFFDTRCPADTTVFAEQLRVFAGLDRCLSSQGTDYCAAFLTGDGCKILYGARSSSGDIIAALARTETSKGETALNDFLADPASAELEKIICITAHDIPETERVSIVKVSPRKGTP